MKFKVKIAIHGWEIGHLSLSRNGIVTVVFSIADSGYILENGLKACIELV